LVAVFVGISGWTYAGWRRSFYPEDLPHTRELSYASRRFNTIEVNGTHYSLQSPRAFASWYDAAPRGFVFAIKGSRYITHMLRAKRVEAPLANFFAVGLLGLRDKLGPILWQFPARFHANLQRLDRFLALLPHDFRSATELARRHDHRVKESLVDIGRNRPIRHAVELRHESWFRAELVDLLRRHGVALVFSDSPKHWPYVEEPTADFVYMRLHGSQELYASSYTDEELDEHGRKIRSWTRGQIPRGSQRVAGAAADRRRRDVYVYFDNDAKVHAPFDAARLARRLKLATPAMAEEMRV
jgi:uncharacterized protein YecE (DUF72 family)